VKVLHLFANHKWTGPAELAVNLCVGLQRRGMDVTFAAGSPPPDNTGHVAACAEERGLEVRTGLVLSKHLRWVSNYLDARLLRKWFRHERWDIIHTHLPNDHMIAAMARRRFHREVSIVRSSYDGGGMKSNARGRWLMRRATDALMEASKMGLAADQRQFDLTVFPVEVIPPAVDLERFNPDRDLPSMRSRLDLNEADCIFGIVARMQTHRRFEVLLEAVRMAAQRAPSLRLVIVGRGTNQEAVARAPVREMGLGDVVRFAGYLRGDEYVGILKAFDVKVFLVPGSDGSCRAVREAMAMGKPVIAADRGLLPELVRDGQTGLVIEDTPDTLAESMVLLASDQQQRREMGRRARRYALDNLGIDRQAAAVACVYQRCLESTRGRK